MFPETSSHVQRTSGFRPKCKTKAFDAFHFRTSDWTSISRGAVLVVRIGGPALPGSTQYKAPDWPVL